MNRKEAYDNKYKKKIDKIIQNNTDKNYLRGFYNYMGSRLAYSTKYDYLNYVVNFINFTEKEIVDIGLDDYTNFLSTIEDMTTPYQISVYSGLKKFATYLIASNKTSDNPMKYIERPKFKEREDTKEKREKGYLEKREIKKYLSSVKSGTGTNRAIARQEAWKERDLLIIMIFLNMGIRCSALYKLDVSSINFDNMTLTTNEKGDKIRTRLISEDLMKYIKDWLIKREIILDGVNESALFISNQRTRMDQSSIYRVVNKYSKSIEGKHITPHKLRATYGTQLLNETHDIYFVQSCMDHSSPQTTELYIRGQKKEGETKSCDIMSKIIF